MPRTDDDSSTSLDYRASGRANTGAGRRWQTSCLQTARVRNGSGRGCGRSMRLADPLIRFPSAALMRQMPTARLWASPQPVALPTVATGPEACSAVATRPYRA